VTKEEFEELQGRLEERCPSAATSSYQSTAINAYDLRTLLDAADERDRLRALLADIYRVEPILGHVASRIRAALAGGALVLP